MNIGKAKFYFDRARDYSAAANFLMLLYLTVLNSHIGWFWPCIGLCCYLVFIWFEVKYIAPKHFAYMNTMNPTWNELIAKIDKLIETQKESSRP